MRPTRRALLASTAASIGLAGCFGAGGDSTTTETTTEETTTETTTEETTTTTTEAEAATVQVREHSEHGEILTDADGRTLYMFDSDERGSGESTCTGGCLDNWPALTVEDEPTAGDGVTAELTTFERGDGETQVAAAGWPLYYFAPDEEPGDAKGQGVGDVWWVLRPDGTPVKPETTTTTTEAEAATVQVREHSEHGEILVDAEGMTLYMFDSDERGSGESSCSGGCLDNWPALTVEDEPTAGDGVTADLTTFERGDGETQVAAAGWPLYYFAPDEEPGDAKGQGVGDVWWVLRPDGTPVKPGTTTTTEASAPTVQVRSHPDHGEILVDSEGLSLYMFDSDERGSGESTCSGGCAENWPALTVEGDPTAGEGVTADLTTFERSGGERQVAAAGWPLYYFASDEDPGDAKGQGVGDVWWLLAPDGTPIEPDGGSGDDGDGNGNGNGGGGGGGGY